MSPAWTVYSRVQPARAGGGARAVRAGWVSLGARARVMQQCDGVRTGGGKGEGEEGAEGKHRVRVDVSFEGVSGWLEERRRCLLKKKRRAGGQEKGQPRRFSARLGGAAAGKQQRGKIKKELGRARLPRYVMHTVWGPTRLPPSLSPCRPYPPTLRQHSAAMPASAAQDDEQAFMAALLADLDPVDLFAPPSSPPLPSKTGARVGRRVTSSAGGSTSSAASSASLNVKGASSATPAARASSRLTSKNDRKPLIDSAFPPAASSPRPLLPTGSSSGSSSIIPPQHQHRQQQAFDDLIAGVTFDDDFDGDEWARGSSLPPPPAKKARAVARPVRARIFTSIFPHL